MSNVLWALAELKLTQHAAYAAGLLQWSVSRLAKFNPQVRHAPAAFPFDQRQIKACFGAHVRCTVHKPQMCVWSTEDGI